MWVGETMTGKMYSSQDPLFWLYRANVARIWVYLDHFLRDYGLDPAIGSPVFLLGMN